MIKVNDRGDGSFIRISHISRKGFNHDLFVISVTYTVIQRLILRKQFSSSVGLVQRMLLHSFVKIDGIGFQTCSKAGIDMDQSDKEGIQ